MHSGIGVGMLRQAGTVVKVTQVRRCVLVAARVISLYM